MLTNQKNTVVEPRPAGLKARLLAPSHENTTRLLVQALYMVNFSKLLGHFLDFSEIKCFFLKPSEFFDDFPRTVGQFLHTILNFKVFFRGLIFSKFFEIKNMHRTFSPFLKDKMFFYKTIRIF